MSIRIKKQAKWVAINSDTLWERSLSLSALGLWARIISGNDGHSFNLELLLKVFNDTEEEVKNALEELVQFGIVIYTEPSAYEFLEHRSEDFSV